MMRDLEPCQLCGELHAPEALIEFGGMRVCGECADTAIIRCDRCSAQLWHSDNAGDSDTYLCRSCYENYYTHCEICESLIRTEDAHYEDDDEDTPLCYDCYRQRASRCCIHPYSYKPAPIFYGENDKYMGVELELDCGGESERKARTLLEIANRDAEHMYIKHDGSLDDGMELTTHPLTLDYHLNHMPWVEILDKAREFGYKSHQARTCGLHIHINRSFFGVTSEEQDESIARLLYFFERHWTELLRFSRRTQRQAEQWSNRFGYMHHPKAILDHAKKGFSGIRYTAVNLTNANTVELRLWRGTLRLNTLQATLQLTARICDCAVCLSDDEMRQMSWSAFVSGCTQYPQLIQYLKEKRLYINDPVESEAEV